jgi:hypothetical protein
MNTRNWINKTKLITTSYIATYLISSPTKAHEKIIWLDVSMQKRLGMDKLHSIYLQVGEHRSHIVHNLGKCKKKSSIKSIKMWKKKA